jgi:hypothetical protein
MGENRSDDGGELPEEAIAEAERLTRGARAATDPDEAAACRERRSSLLAEYGFTARVRTEDRDTLVLYPDEWVEEGTVRPDRIENLDRGVERPLEGPGEPEDWAAIEAHNRNLAAAVAEEHGPVHGANAHALADFASNHYAKPIQELTESERAEFLAEYFPRNAWPSDDQKAVVEQSLGLVFETAGKSGSVGRSE